MAMPGLDLPWAPLPSPFPPDKTPRAALTSSGARQTEPVLELATQCVQEGAQSHDKAERLQKVGTAMVTCDL